MLKIKYEVYSNQKEYEKIALTMVAKINMVKDAVNNGLFNLFPSLLVFPSKTTVDAMNSTIKRPVKCEKARKDRRGQFRVP